LDVHDGRSIEEGLALASRSGRRCRLQVRADNDSAFSPKEHYWQNSIAYLNTIWLDSNEAVKLSAHRQELQAGAYPFDHSRLLVSTHFVFDFLLKSRSVRLIEIGLSLWAEIFVYGRILRRGIFSGMLVIIIVGHGLGLS